MQPGGQDLVIQQQVQRLVVSEGDLVAHGEGLASLVREQQRLKKLQMHQQLLHIFLLARLVVGVDEGDVFAAEVLHAVIYHIHQGYLRLVLLIRPEREAQVAQDGIRLVTG